MWFGWGKKVERKQQVGFPSISVFPCGTRYDVHRVAENAGRN